MPERIPPSVDSRFRHLLEAAPDAILEVDGSGRILLINAAAETLFGYTADELCGQHVDLLVPEGVRARHAHHRTNYGAHPVSRPMGSGLLLEAQRRDGTRFPVEISLSPFEADGELRVGAIIRDVTDRIRAEEQIRALQTRYTEELTAANAQLELRSQKIEAANRHKSEFLANMSHELRTPLHTIIGFAELLSESAEGPLTERGRRFVDHILRDGKHLLELINDILDLSKIEAGRLDLHLELLDWTAALREVIETIQPQALNRQVNLSAMIPAAGRLFADRRRFLEIIYNLLSNAIKFTPAGGQVWVESSENEEEVTISVRDKGVGIAQEHLERIFDKFYQAGSTGTPREGTGLGLAITKYLVDRHHGRITVTSAPGVGSTFTCSLPVTGPQAATTEMRQTERNSPLVLIVEPDSTVRRLIAGRLTPLGYRAEPAGTIEEATAKARRSGPDAIIVERRTMESESWSSLRELRSTIGASVPIFVLSMLEEALQAVDAPSLARLTKPLDREDLLTTLRRLVPVHPGSSPKILVVNEELTSRRLIQEIPGSAGYLPILNTGAREALETLAKTDVSAVIIDLVTPQVNGFELISQIREKPRLSHLPLIVLTGRAVSGDDFDWLLPQTGAILLKGSSWTEELVRIQAKQ